MRGFKDTKQPTKPSLGDATYNYFIKQAEKEKDRGKKTKAAKERYKTPAYCFGAARRIYEEEQKKKAEEEARRQEEEAAKEEAET